MSSKKTDIKTPTKIKESKIVLSYDIIVESRETGPNFIDVLKQKLINTYKNKSYHLLYVIDIDIHNASISYGVQESLGLWSFKILAESTVLQYNIGDVIEVSFQIKSKNKDNVIFYGTHPHFDCTIQSDNLNDIIYYTDNHNSSIQFKINNEVRRLKNNEKILVSINDIFPSCLHIGFGYYLRGVTHII